MSERATWQAAPSSQAASSSRARSMSQAVLTLPAGLALLASGAASLINEVIWQRSLGRFLGGSETLSSMLIVLVFMAGLGAGSLWTAGRMGRLGDPLRALATVEVALAGAALLVRALLASDLAFSAFRVQALAVSMGVPLVAVYAVLALVILAGPCLLMGATLPLASEACQSRLGWRDARRLGLLFFVNTLGSVGGALAATAILVPRLGQSASLALAAGLSLSAGLVLALVSATIPPQEPSARASAPAPASLASRRSLLPLSREELLALGLGFCSLGYELYLLRLLPLRHGPMPFTFAAVVAGFLLFWSLGAAHSVRGNLTLATGLALCAASTALSAGALFLDRPEAIEGLASLSWFLIRRFAYFVPCFFFGDLFGRVTASAARSWGADVGRIYGWSTCGSCLGILAVTLVGYEMHIVLLALLLCCLLLALREKSMTPPPSSRPAWAPLSAAALTLVLSSCFRGSGALGAIPLGDRPMAQTFFGRDGVVGLDAEGNLFWNGLWHSRLSRGRDHIGTNNWRIAVFPVLSHSRGKIRDGCVIGLGAGITAATLAKLATVETVDGYEINRTLEEILTRYRAETLGVRGNPRVRIVWQDARSGFTLNEKKYDVVVSEPLYLKQSGSGLLNSAEFYRLVSRRLKPGGVFGLYSNGTGEQAFAVRQTAAQVFPYRVSFLKGYLLVLSNDPIVLTEEALGERFQQAGADPLWSEIRSHPPTRDPASVLRLADRPPLEWGDGRLVATDDRPIIEFPRFLEWEVSRLGYRVPLPWPE